MCDVPFVEGTCLLSEVLHLLEVLLCLSIMVLTPPKMFLCPLIVELGSGIAFICYPPLVCLLHFDGVEWISDKS